MSATPEEATDKPVIRRREGHQLMSWEVVYCGEQYAIAASQKEAFDRLEDLQWSGRLPGKP